MEYWFYWFYVTAAAHVILLCVAFAVSVSTQHEWALKLSSTAVGTAAVGVAVSLMQGTAVWSALDWPPWIGPAVIVVTAFVSIACNTVAVSLHDHTTKRERN